MPQRVQGKERSKSFIGGRWPWPSVGPGPLMEGRIGMGRVEHLGHSRRTALTLASAISAAFCLPTAGLYFTSKSQATEVPLQLASWSPSLRAAAEVPMDTGWSAAADQESQVGAGTVRVGCSVVSLSGLGKGPGSDEALRYPISLARLTVNESFLESWNLGRNNSWLVMGQRRSWDKRDRHLITFWCALQPKMSYFTLLEFPKKKKYKLRNCCFWWPGKLLYFCNNNMNLVKILHSHKLFK